MTLLGDKLTCPRRIEGPHREVNLDTWKVSHIGAPLLVCSYCGSANPEQVLDGLEDGRYSVGTTTKSYKIYVMPSHDKCYFQHFTPEQQFRFVQLHNQRREQGFFHPIEIGGVSRPVGFSVMPFFMRRSFS